MLLGTTYRSLTPEEHQELLEKRQARNRRKRVAQKLRAMKLERTPAVSWRGVRRVHYSGPAPEAL